MPGPEPRGTKRWAVVPTNRMASLRENGSGQPSGEGEADADREESMSAAIRLPGVVTDGTLRTSAWEPERPDWLGSCPERRDGMHNVAEDQPGVGGVHSSEEAGNDRGAKAPRR